MAKYWGLRSPKIVLSIISDIIDYKPWKNQRLKDDFEKGIIKVFMVKNCFLLPNRPMPHSRVKLKLRGGSRISGKGVHIYIVVGVRFLDFILFFLNIP